ncbi:MAG: polymerase, sigma 28 subunit, SigK, partial [Clostridiales bacterium]|nr:polymerase, sigma 28 subunit, SigK [Clostridiales bacterium]
QPLTSDEEQQYIEAYKNGNEDARNILIERNLRLVAHIVKKYSSNGTDSDDLISIGTIGLIKAISTFDLEKGTRLATYAARCIENEILMSKGMHINLCTIIRSPILDNDHGFY